MLLNKLHVTISTKDRYSILHSALFSIINQTQKPKWVTIYDDSKELVDLRELPVFLHIFKMFEYYGIEWNVHFGPKKGQVWNHQHALENSPAKYVFRMDDDNILEYDVLVSLYNILENNNDCGAAASCILHTDKLIEPKETSPYLKDSLDKLAIQFAPFKGIKCCEHLYSSFMYRKKIASNYNLNLSPVGHREETLFSHDIHRRGYKLMVKGDITTWHIREPKGGIRSEDLNYAGYWEHDDQIFKQQLIKWGVRNDVFIVVLNGGIGDNFAFMNLLPQLKKKYKRIKLATVYPEIYLNETNIEIISIQEALNIFGGNIDHYDIYKFMMDNNWKKSLIEAYEELYLK